MKRGWTEVEQKIDADMKPLFEKMLEQEWRTARTLNEKVLEVEEKIANNSDLIAEVKEEMAKTWWIHARDDGEQNLNILELEETIAEQQKTIEDLINAVKMGQFRVQLLVNEGKGNFWTPFFLLS